MTSGWKKRVLCMSCSGYIYIHCVKYSMLVTFVGFLQHSMVLPINANPQSRKIPEQS